MDVAEAPAVIVESATVEEAAAASVASELSEDVLPPVAVSAETSPKAPATRKPAAQSAATLTTIAFRVRAEAIGVAGSPGAPLPFRPNLATPHPPRHSGASVRTRGQTFRRGRSCAAFVRTSLDLWLGRRGRRSRPRAPTAIGRAPQDQDSPLRPCSPPRTRILDRGLCH